MSARGKGINYSEMGIASISVPFDSGSALSYVPGCGKQRDGGGVLRVGTVWRKRAVPRGLGRARVLQRLCVRVCMCVCVRVCVCVLACLGCDSPLQRITIFLCCKHQHWQGWGGEGSRAPEPPRADVLGCPRGPGDVPSWCLQMARARGSGAGMALEGDNGFGVSSGHLHIALVGLPLWFISPRLWLSFVTQDPGAVSTGVSRGGEVPKVEERRFLHQDLSSC